MYSKSHQAVGSKGNCLKLSALDNDAQQSSTGLRSDSTSHLDKDRVGNVQILSPNAASFCREEPEKEYVPHQSLTADGPNSRARIGAQACERKTVNEEVDRLISSLTDLVEKLTVERPTSQPNDLCKEHETKRTGGLLDMLHRRSFVECHSQGNRTHTGVPMMKDNVILGQTCVSLGCGRMHMLESYFRHQIEPDAFTQAEIRCKRYVAKNLIQFMLETMCVGK